MSEARSRRRALGPGALSLPLSASIFLPAGRSARFGCSRCPLLPALRPPRPPLRCSICSPPAASPAPASPTPELSPDGARRTATAARGCQGQASSQLGAEGGVLLSTPHSHRDGRKSAAAKGGQDKQGSAGWEPARKQRGKIQENHPKDAGDQILWGTHRVLMQGMLLPGRC